jgi:Reverse transcriptase (RNA-dependent DNA polymerase)
MTGLIDDITDKISLDGYNEHCIVTVKDVIDAVSRLKPGKHDGHLGLSSNHVKHACDEWYTHASLLLTALTVHGCVTEDLSISTVLPISKGRNLNYSDSANYRGIALSSIFGKIYDLYILARYDCFLATSKLQFGFKAGFSTSMCSMILKETLEYYRRKGSTVYCTMLDASKAFDRVNYCKLVRLLIINKLPPIIIRLLLQMYLFNFAQVAWNGTLSTKFRVSNGVRQGAILSPVLFCIYFDVLLGKLSSNGDGCYIGLFFVGALAYADDLVLLAPSASAMRSMLNSCDAYATQYNVLFNAKKSKCIRCQPIGAVKCFSRLTFRPSFYIGSNYIEFVDKWPHLGHIITNDCDDFEDIKAKKCSLIGQVNKILCTFSNVNCLTKSKLVKSYCTSFYGAEIWDQSNAGIESICMAWRKGIRRIWQVPLTTHSALIPGMCDTLPLTDLFYKRMLNFVYRCFKSESPLVRFIVRHGTLFGEMDSIIGRNVLNCALRYNTCIDRISNLEFCSLSIDKHVRSSYKYSDITNLLSELLQCRDGTLRLSDPNFSFSDVLAMIDILCTR